MLFPQIEQLGGANTAVSPLIQPQNSPTVLNGCNISYRLGAILKDTGYSRVGDVATDATKSITGLHNFRQTAAIQKILRTKNNDAGTNLLLQYNNAGTWTNINVSTTYDAFEDSKTEMEDFIGYCFIVGYDSTDGVFLPVGSLTGTTFSTATNVTSMPQAKYVKRYRDRIYIANCYYSAAAYPYRVYFSSIPSAGAITWTPASDFFDLDFSEEITGIAENWDRLMVFTAYSAYMYDQDQKRKIWATGCSAHRTIDTSGPYMIWANFDGVWMSTGGQPMNIGGPVIDFIRKGTPANFFGKVVDEEYHLYVGTVAVNGVTYTNCELVFNIPTSTWRWREFYHNMTVYEEYNDTGNQRLYMGSSVGEVYNKGKYTDSTLISGDGYISGGTVGQPIHANFELAPLYFGNLKKTKMIKGITAFAERAQGLKLKYRVLERNNRALTPYMQLGELTDYVNSFDIANNDGVMIQIAGYEYSTNPYFSFLGAEYDIELEGDQPKLK